MNRLTLLPDTPALVGSRTLMLLLPALLLLPLAGSGCGQSGSPQPLAVQGLPLPPGIASRTFTEVIAGKALPRHTLTYYLDTSPSGLDKEAELNRRANLIAENAYRFAQNAGSGSEILFFATSTVAGRPTRIFEFQVPARQTERQKALRTLRAEVIEAVLNAYRQTPPPTQSPILEDVAYLADYAGGGRSGSVYIVSDLGQFSDLLTAAQVLTARTPADVDSLVQRTLEQLPSLPSDRRPEQMMTIYVRPSPKESPLLLRGKRQLQAFFERVMKEWGVPRRTSFDL